MSSFLRDITATALHKTLDANALRQQMAAHNIANVDTPGYRPAHITFQQQLRATINDSRRLSGPAGPTQRLQELRPASRPYVGAALRADGNAVSLENEMAELAESNLHYQSVVRLMARKLQLLRSAATEGAQ